MRTFLLALGAAAPLSLTLSAAGHAAGGTVIWTTPSEYKSCVRSGGEEYYEEGDDIRICEYTSGTWAGSQIWCDADFHRCEFVTVPPSAPPETGNQANTTTDEGAGLTQAPDQGGRFGATDYTTQILQLQD